MIVYRELSTLERDLGFSAKTLYAVSNSIDRHYHKVTLPKKSGGTRTLSVPDEILKKIQRAIAEKLLAYHPVSQYAKAYKPAASVKRNAMPHVGKKKLLKLYILHFFDSVLYNTVKDRVFPETVFSEKLRILLSMLCYYRDVLPQGAPTSPVITNIILYDFDETIGDFCLSRGIAYTRYCDDMTFSGDFDEKEIIKTVQQELNARGFLLNRKKTAVVPSSKRQVVTGIVVNEKLSLSRSARRSLRQALYYCKTYGVSEHLAHCGIHDTPKHYLESLLGKIAYALSIDPDDSELLNCKETVTRLLQE
ncbi:MAG: RNA-directed DNA polymerase [Clostridia bacterium]|nr:RNA-directed DNA polymerase [Clostridia bacterium]